MHMKKILLLIVLLSSNSQAMLSDMDSGINRENKERKSATDFIYARNYYPESILIVDGYKLYTFSKGIESPLAFAVIPKQ